MVRVSIVKSLVFVITEFPIVGEPAGNSSPLAASPSMSSLPYCAPTVVWAARRSVSA